LGVLLAAAALVLLGDATLTFVRNLLGACSLITAEFADVKDAADAAFRAIMIELGLLTVLSLVLVVSLALLRRRPTIPAAER